MELLQTNISSGSGSRINSSRGSRSMPLSFKLKRRSSYEFQSDRSFSSPDINVNSPRNCSADSSAVKLNTSKLRVKCKKRSYALSPHLLQRSVCLNALKKKKSLASGDAPSIQNVNEQNVSLNSSNMQLLLCDSKESSFNSTEISEFSANDSFSMTDGSSFEISHISSNCNNSTVDSTFDNDWNYENSERDEIAEKINRRDSRSQNLVPMFCDYQLVGDSQLLRFAQKILGMERDFSQISSGSLGLCVSGQKISDLHRRVIDKFHPVGEQLVLLIGTNDLMKHTSSSEMCRGLDSLLRTLFRSAEKIIILTLPPVPRMAHNDDHWTRMDSYNKYIKSLPEKFEGKITVADVSPLFYNASTRVCRYSCFERWFQNGVRKDLIHINEKGFKMIKHFLLKKSF